MRRWFSAPYPNSLIGEAPHPPTTNTKEAEVEWLYEDLQDLLKLTPKKDVLFIIGDWNAEVGSQQIPGVTGKFDLKYKMKQGKG